MAEERNIPIPEQIHNDIVSLMNEMSDHDREIAYRNQKKKLAHAKVWDLIGDKVPETRGIQCSLNLKSKTITVNKKMTSLSDLLFGGLLGDFPNGGDLPPPI